MTIRIKSGLAAASAIALALALCGCGGGGGGVASTPPPPTPTPTPTPPPTPAAVAIFPSPTVGEFASAGVATMGHAPVSDFGPLSSADASQVHIRYTSAGNYEIQIPGAQWDQLGFAKGTVPADPSTFNFFQPESASQGGAYLSTSVTKTEGYLYSEMAAWSDGGDKFGVVAFGQPTAASNMPVGGSATYSGLVRGTTDVIGFDGFDGNFNTPVDGSVALNFDFGKGSLSGAMTLDLQNPTGTGGTPLGTFAFTDTVYSTGSLTYSGAFDTSVSGDNFFLGQFTGPGAAETIGAWALPFQFDGKTKQAFGAWVAKH